MKETKDQIYQFPIAETLSPAGLAQEVAKKNARALLEVAEVASPQGRNWKREYFVLAMSSNGSNFPIMAIPLGLNSLSRTTNFGTQAQKIEDKQTLDYYH